MTSVPGRFAKPTLRAQLPERHTPPDTVVAWSSLRSYGFRATKNVLRAKGVAGDAPNRPRGFPPI